MPGKILGLDISEDAITAVQVKSGLKGHQVMACARVTFEGDRRLEDALKSISEKMDLKSDLCFTGIPGEQASYRNLTLPFKDPKKIRQALPFEIETLVPFPLDKLLVDFALVNGSVSDENEILAVSVQKSYLSQCLQVVQSLGIEPEVVDVRCVPLVSWLLRQEEIPEDGIFLDIGDKRGTMVLYVKRRMALIRTFALTDGVLKGTNASAAGDHREETGRSAQVESRVQGLCTLVRNTIHAFGSNSHLENRPETIFFSGSGALYPETGALLTRFLDIPAEQIDLSTDKRVSIDEHAARMWNPLVMDNALALTLRDAKQGRGFNFRKDEFEIRKHYQGLKKGLRQVAVFLILIFSFLMVDMGVDYYLLKKRNAVLDENIRQAFRRTFPDVKKIVDPVQQAKVKISELKQSGLSNPEGYSKQTVLDLLRDISERIPKSVDVHVTRMVVDSDSVRITGTTDTFNTVDNLKSGLETSPYFGAVSISSENLDRTGKRVQFELRLERKKEVSTGGLTG
jgi:general secretion pathway protein L